MLELIYDDYLYECWLPFLVDGELVPVYIDLYNETVKEKYGEPVVLNKGAWNHAFLFKSSGWKSKEELEKDIDAHMHQCYYNSMFDKQFAEPYMQSIKESNIELNNIGNFVSFKGELSLYQMSKMAWNQGFKLEIVLMPKENDK